MDEMDDSYNNQPAEGGHPRLDQYDHKITEGGAATCDQNKKLTKIGQRFDDRNANIAALTNGLQFAGYYDLRCQRKGQLHAAKGYSDRQRSACNVIVRK